LDGRGDRLAFLNGTDFAWLLEVLVPNNPFEDLADQDAFIAEVPDPTGRDPEDYRLAYNKLCLRHALRGQRVAPADLPSLIIRAVSGDALAAEIENATGYAFDMNDMQSRFVSPFDAPRWVNGAELLQEFVGNVPALHLSHPKWSRAVFVTFRGTDSMTDGQPASGLVEDAVHEASYTPLGSVAERIDHHLALGYDDMHLMVLYCYECDSYGEFRVPVAPDARDHKFFRPEDPANHPTCGRTHPELLRAGPCHRCPDCTENELVHANNPLNTGEMWMAFIKGQP
jgi:hypothetical protein